MSKAAVRSWDVHETTGLLAGGAETCDEVIAGVDGRADADGDGIDAGTDVEGCGAEAAGRGWVGSPVPEQAVASPIAPTANQYRTIATTTEVNIGARASVEPETSGTHCSSGVGTGLRRCDILPREGEHGGFAANTGCLLDQPSRLAEIPQVSLGDRPHGQHIGSLLGCHLAAHKDQQRPGFLRPVLHDPYERERDTGPDILRQETMSVFGERRGLLDA